MKNPLSTCNQSHAKTFKKIVLHIESIQFRLLKPFSKFIIHKYEQHLDKELHKSLINKTQEEVAYLTNICLQEKLRFRQEINHGKHRNYHLGYGNIDNTLAYLQWNKDIHTKSLKSNIIKILISILIIISPLNIIPNLIIIYLIYQILSLIINYECINLQNYNINRINRRIAKIKQLENHKLQQKQAKYNHVATAVSKLLLNSSQVPTNEQIINTISTKEDIEAMQQYIQHITNKRKIKSIRR